MYYSFLIILTLGMIFTCLMLNPDDPASVGYPPALRMTDGPSVLNSQDWLQKRRPEVMRQFREQVYGEAPPKPEIQSELKEEDSAFLDGLAKRYRLLVHLLLGERRHTLDVMLILPASASKEKPCGLFLGLNFCGNHGVHPDPRISLNPRWMPKVQPGVENHRATQAHRGVQASRWPLEYILRQGFGVATVYYGDIEEDHPEGWKNGVRNLFPVAGKTGDDLPSHAWGAIGAWAWGLSRIMDALEKLPQIQAQRVFLHGHSRLGKTALWAGACDQRFAMVISNNSGEGGAALARRLQGERTADLNRVFPHWFCRNFHQFSGKEQQLPVDQHLLIAAIAPRPVYIASASEDAWADPEGEFLAGIHAEPVYKLFGLEGLGTAKWPGVQQPVGSYIRYHLRQGKHDVTQYDWECWVQAVRELSLVP